MLNRFLRSIPACIICASGPSAALAAVSPETGRWIPGIGDPTLFGWLTVAIYLFAAGFAATNIPRAARIGKMASWFWVGLVAALLALAINKQLDLQSWFSQVARDFVLVQGWYESRRVLQAIFIAAIFTLGLSGVIVMRLWFAANWKAYSTLWIGLACLAAFVVIRAATFHDIDVLLSFNLAGASINFMMEAGSLAIVILGVLKWKSVSGRSAY